MEHAALSRATSLAAPGAGAPGAFIGSSLSQTQLRLLLLALSLATGMEFYTFDSMNLVLADLTGSLGVSADEASWILTIYSSTLFLGVPVSIWTAGYFGHKRFLIVSVILFAAASMGCAISPDLQSMLDRTGCPLLRGTDGRGQGQPRLGPEQGARSR